MSHLGNVAFEVPVGHASGDVTQIRVDILIQNSAESSGLDINIWT